MQLHVGQEHPDPATDARAVPVYQTTSYVFGSSAQAAARFDLKEEGNIYGRSPIPPRMCSRSAWPLSKAAWPFWRWRPAPLP